MRTMEFSLSVHVMPSLEFEGNQVFLLRNGHSRRNECACVPIGKVEFWPGIDSWFEEHFIRKVVAFRVHS